MSAIKPVFRELKDAALTGLAALKHELHQFVDAIDDHADDVIRRVRNQDHFDPRGDGSAAVLAQSRPGFHADGSVNASDFRTPRDGAYYWSGMYPRKGEVVAGEIANRNGATTLEMLITERGIEMPEWDDKNPASVETWTQVSEAYASGASGQVHAVLGDNLRSDAVWWKELERLQSNENVTEIIRIHPDTLDESVIFSR